MGRIIGIDLGTTNSVVAIMEGKEPKVIANEEGGRLTPSVVAWDANGDVLVGQIARRQAVTNPENTIFSAKRFIGRRFEEAAEDIKRMPFKSMRGAHGEVDFEIRGKKVTPPEVSAKVLGKLKKAAEDHPGRKGHRGSHHGTGLLQRLAAPGHQGCRPHRRPRRQAHR